MIVYVVMSAEIEAEEVSVMSAWSTRQLADAEVARREAADHDHWSEWWVEEKTLDSPTGEPLEEEW